MADSVELTGQASHYLARVLRLSDGDRLILFNGDGKEYVGSICGVQRQRVQVKLFSSHFPDNESALKITLVQAISRGERMDYCLQKATELGVACIQPLNSRRVEVRLDEKRLSKRLAHWQAVVISACEQSGRAVVPEVKTPLSLSEWFEHGLVSHRLVLDPQAEKSLSSLAVSTDEISILVGPEGGFSNEELTQLRSKGVEAVSLGPRVLRTETAGPVAIAVLQALAGDL